MKIMKPKKRLLSVFLVLAVLFSAVFSGAYASGGGALGGGGSTSSNSGGGASSGGGSSSGSIYEDYSYYLDNLFFFDANGNKIYEPQNSCFVEFDITTVKQNAARAVAVITAYSDTGKLLSMQFMGVKPNFGNTVSMPGVMIYFDGAYTVDDVRVFVWDSIQGMKPLSNVLSSKFLNERDEIIAYDIALINTDDFGCWSNGGFYFPDDLGCIEFYKDKNTSNTAVYYLQTAADGTVDPDIYINGVLYEGSAAEALSDFVINNKHGLVTLVDKLPRDGIYDEIYADYYITGEITSISESTGRISLSSVIGKRSAGSFTPDENTVFSLGKNRISASGLKVGDIVSVASDVNGWLNNTTVFEVLASRNTVKGTLTGTDPTEEVLYFDGKGYNCVGKLDYITYNLTVGEPYVVYLDAFGMAFKCAFDTSTIKYGIIDDYADSTFGDEDEILLFTAEGTVMTCTFNAAKASIKEDDALQAYHNESAVKTFIKNKVFVNGSRSAGKTPVSDRVVIYKINENSGEVSEINFLSPARTADREYDLFNRAKGSLGVVRMDSETKVIDAIEYTSNGYEKASDLSITDVSGFADNMGYTAYAFGDKNANQAYPVVVVTEGPKPYNRNTHFAVCYDAPYKIIDQNGDEVFELDAFYAPDDSDRIKFIIKEDATGDDPAGLTAGDIIVFKADSNRYIKDLHVISKWQDISQFSTVLNGVINGDSFIDLSEDLAAKAENWQTTEGIRNSTDIRRMINREDVTLAFGPVVDYGRNYITLGIVEDGKTKNDGSGTFDIGITSDTQGYFYDYSFAAKMRLSVDSAQALPCIKPIEDDNGVIDWSSWDNEIASYAFVLASDGEAKDIFVLEPR